MDRLHEDSPALLPTARGLREWPQRIPYPEVRERGEGVYGPLTNGQLIARHLPTPVSGGISALAGALLREGALSAEVRQMIIVRVGYLTASLYEVVQHSSLAERVGLSRLKIEQLAMIVPEGLTESEAALIAFIDALVADNRVEDALLDAVRAQFDDGQVLEAVVVTGHWWMLSRLLSTAGIPVDEQRIGDNGIAPA